MKIKYLILCLPLMLTSCAIYRQKFDCPPDQGVPCTSVSDLEQMIVETEIGPDVFLGINPTQHQIKDTPSSNRIWISDCKGHGHYIYFPKEDACCIH